MGTDINAITPILFRKTSYLMFRLLNGNNMFQKFEQTMVSLIFDTMDLHYGIKLMRDLRF